MRALTLVRGGATLGITCALLTVVWLSLASAGWASSAPVSGATPALTPAHSPLLPDPRWLTLIRSDAPRVLNTPQATPPSINIHLTDGFVAGRTPIATSVSITVARGGTEVAHASATPFLDGGGFFYVGYLDWSYQYGGGGGIYGPLQAADVVWVKQANTVVSMTVPAFSGLAAPDTDTVYGTAPISQAVTVYLYPFAAPDTTYTRTVMADVTGHYQVIWIPEVDLRPRDSGYVVYAEAADRRAYARFVAPFLRVQVNGGEVSGLAAPFSSVDITVTDKGGTPRAQLYAFADSRGAFRSRYQPPWWRQDWRLMRPGDRVIAVAAGQTFSMTVLTLTAHADVSTGSVWGEAPADKPVEVIRRAGPLRSGDDGLWLQSDGETVVTATASGMYTATALLAHADYGAASVSSPEGHQTVARFAMPYVWVQLGEIGPYEDRLAWGQIDDPGVPVTMTIQGPSGYPKGLLNFTTSDNGYFFIPGGYSTFPQNPIVESGDLITLTSPRGTGIAVELPMLTVQAYPLSDTIAGLAPAGSRVTVSVFEGHGGTFVVTATTQGNYSIDLGGEVDITDNTMGTAEIATADGYTVARAFRAIRSCQPRLLRVQVGGNLVEGQAPGFDCPGALLRLRDSHGQIKAQRVLLGDYYLMELYDDDMRPVPILPGDTIETEVPGRSSSTATPTPWPGIASTEAQSQTITTLIPTLTVDLDAVANVATGQASPAAVIQLGIWREGSIQRTLTTTVSAEGNYTVSLAGLYTLTAGDRVRVFLDSFEQPQFHALGVLPLIKATLYQSQVYGWLPPLTPYTVSLESTRTVTAQVSGYAYASGYIYFYLPPAMPGDTVVITTPQRVLRLGLPFLSARVDRATATIAGQAPAGARLQVDLLRISYDWAQASQQITASASGTYTVAFPDLAPLRDTRGSLTYFNPEDQQIRLDFAVAQWRVTLSDPCLSGNAEAAGAPITITLQTGGGVAKGVFTGTAGLPSAEFQTCFTQTVESGDRLSLIQSGSLMTFSVPVVTADHDYARQVLEGQAPPLSPIDVTLQSSEYYWQWTYRHILADAHGHYGLDTSGLHLLPNIPGYIVVTDKTSNTIRRNFSIRGLRLYLPFVVRN